MIQELNDAELSAADRGVQLKLQRGGLERLAGDPWPAALGPVRHHVARPA
jgi:hypothetical protein